MVGIYRKISKLTDGSELYDVLMIRDEKKGLILPANDAAHAEQIRRKMVELLDVAGVAWIDCGDQR